MLVARRFPEYWSFRTRASRAALIKAPQSIDSLSGAHRSGPVQGVSSYVCSLVPTDSVDVKRALVVVRPRRFRRARRNVGCQLDDPWRGIPDSADRVPQPVERWPFADDRRSDPRHRGSTMTMTLASGAMAAVSCPLCHVVDRPPAGRSSAILQPPPRDPVAPCGNAATAAYDGAEQPAFPCEPGGAPSSAAPEVRSGPCHP